MEIKENINWENLGRGLSKYKEIMARFNEPGDLVSDTIFKRSYKGYYKIRRNDEFCDFYFSILQNNRGNKDITFDYVLSTLFEKFNMVEASFSSKLIATINPDLPIWDSFVLKNLKNQLGSKIKGKDKIQQSIIKYDNLKKWYEDNLATDQYRNLITIFDQRFPDSGISDLKKVDLILWQIR